MNTRKVLTGVIIAILAIWAVVLYTNHKNGIPVVKEDNVAVKLDSVLVLSDSLKSVSDSTKK